MASLVNDRFRPGPLHEYARGFAMAAAVLGAVLLAGAGTALAAEPLPIELDWEDPETCPKNDDIQRDVRQLLGDGTIPDAVPLTVAKVSIQQSPDGFFEVRVRTTSGGDVRERELRVETCHDARQFVAFLLAFLIDPRTQQQAPAESPPATSASAPTSTAPPTSTSSPAIAPPPAASPARRDAAPPPVRAERQPSWTASALIGVDLGVLPSASVGGELRAGLLFSSWSVEVRAAAWLPRSAESASVADAGGDFTLLDVGALGCLRLEPGQALSVRTCAGPALLSLWGKGYGVTAPAEEHANFGAAAAEATLLVAIAARTSLRLGVGGLVPFRRPTFAIHEVGQIHRPSAVAGRASLGFEVAF